MDIGGPNLSSRDVKITPTNPSLRYRPGGQNWGGGYLVKTSRPGDGDHLRGGNEIRTNNNNNKINKNKSIKFHILCRIHDGSLLGGFLIRALSEITNFDPP